MKKIAFAALAAVIAATGASAQSGTYTFTFDHFGLVETGSLGGTLDADGNHFIVSSNGSFTFDGAPFSVVSSTPMSVDTFAGFGGGLRGDGTATMTLDGSYLDYFSGDLGNFVAFAVGDAYQLATQPPFSEYFDGVDNEVFAFDVSNFHASFRADGAVPEPASWALMLGGFGLVGGAMRSRRTNMVAFG